MSLAPGREEVHGPDVLAAYTRRLADGHEWPDLLLMVGDQVYADETGPEMQEFIRAPMTWRLRHGPWFPNAVATLHVDGSTASVRWEAVHPGTALYEIDRASLSKILQR